MTKRGLEERERRLNVRNETRPDLQAAEGRPPVLTGYGAVFGRMSQDLGGFVEQVEPAAFNRTLETADVMGLFNHGTDQILGRSSAKTMRLSVDDVGLRYEIDLPDTTVGRDVAEYARRGDLTGSSFSFRAMKNDGDSWSQTDEGMPLRTLRNVELFDVGPVTYPAYLDTTAEGVSLALRSLVEPTGHSLEHLMAAARRNRLALLLRKRSTDDVAFDDIRLTVTDAITDHLGMAEDESVWVLDLSDTWVVYEIGADLFRLEYSMADDGTVTFSGEPVEVVRKTTYETAPPDPGEPGRSLQRHRSTLMGRR